MNLLAYIQGKRKGKEAHRIEREAMRDPFLADALEGFDAIGAHHAERINAIRMRLSGQERKSNRKVVYIAGIAASLLLCISIGGYFLINKEDAHSLIAKSETAIKEEGIVEDILTENEMEEDKRTADDILEDLDEQVQNNKQNETSDILYAPPETAVQEEELQIIVADELVVIEDAEIELPEIAFADVQDVQPKEDSLMTAQAAKAKHSPNATQRALTTTDASRKPEPKIGMGAYKKYLKESMIRPKEGDCAKKKGNVIVEFKINTEGKPYDFVYRKKLCEDLDKEAIRLIENGPVWVGDTDKSVMLEIKF